MWIAWEKIEFDVSMAIVFYLLGSRAMYIGSRG